MEKAFKPVFFSLTGVYLIIIILLLLADFTYIKPADFAEALRSPEILYALKLSLITSFITAVLSLIVSIPAGYALARWNFPGKEAINVIFDLPIILPPLIIGVSLLVFFQTQMGNFLKSIGLDLVFTIPGIVAAQFVVACAFTFRTIKTAFDGLDYRLEDVAKTLGCNSWQAFLKVSLPLAGKGIIAGGIIGWARAIGEFGPIIVFSGTTRFKTEVLPTTIFLELSIGRIESALAVSLILVLISIFSITMLRLLVKRSIYD
jgi:molybdate transport system permease protein